MKNLKKPHKIKLVHNATIGYMEMNKKYKLH